MRENESGGGDSGVGPFVCEIQNRNGSSYDLPTPKSRSRWKLAVKSGSTASWSAGVRLTRRGMYRTAFYSYQT